VRAPATAKKNGEASCHGEKNAGKTCLGEKEW
jgi:hypothetical protein